MSTQISLLRLPAVRERTGLSRSSIYERVQDGSFPPPVQLGARAVAWASDSIDQWISEKVRASRPELTSDAAQARRKAIAEPACEGASR
jgi:prophage regulatory protein